MRQLHLLTIIISFLVSIAIIGCRSISQESSPNLFGFRSAVVEYSFFGKAFVSLRSDTKKVWIANYGNLIAKASNFNLYANRILSYLRFGNLECGS